MIYLLSDTGRKNQLLYAFDTKKSFESIEYKLVRLEHVQYDFDGNLLVDSAMLKELEGFGVPIFESKSSAKKYMTGLCLVGKAKYVGLRFKCAYEVNSIDLSIRSTWTDLNR